MEYKYMVCTQCITFNHKPFIEDALHGFAMQQTTFPLVTVLIDDASTDGEGPLLCDWAAENLDLDAECAYVRDLDYAHVICAPLKNNASHTFVFLFLRENHYSLNKTKSAYFSEWADKAKYHATCEGDDYWTEPLKLQKQVDYLEKNPTVAFTCHRYKVFDQELNKWESDGFEKRFADVKEGFRFKAYQNRGWMTKYLSLVFRADFLDEYRKMGSTLDYMLVYFLFKKGDAYIFNEFWGVYRKHDGGVWGKYSKLGKARKAYAAVKKLYEFDPNPVTRYKYYDRYATLFVLTKGGVLFHEKFEFRKFFSLFYFCGVKLNRLVFGKRK